MQVGIDLGYSAVKALGVADRPPVCFPSVVGTPDRARFSMNGHNEIVIDVPGDGTWLVGDGAVAQSEFLDRREDRGWIESGAYRRLMLAAFTELTSATSCDLVTVTGLPVAFYESDKDTVRDVFLGAHRVAREGRRAQLFRVTDCRVLPQPFGALLAEALDNRGNVINKQLATSKIGVIDVGGKTTNLLSANRLAEIGRETGSVNVGAWKIARAVRRRLSVTCPDLDLRDHEVIDLIKDRAVTYFGERIDLGDVIDEVIEPMSDQVLAEATQLWNGGGGLAAILVAGGGAHLLGDKIARHFRHARIVAEPTLANARGFWRYAQRLG